MRKDCGGPILLFLFFCFFVQEKNLLLRAESLSQEKQRAKGNKNLHLQLATWQLKKLDPFIIAENYENGNYLHKKVLTKLNKCNQNIPKKSAGWLAGFVDGWMGGGSKSCFKDCLQQSKTNLLLNKKVFSAILLSGNI